MFDLEKQIAEWREQMLSAGIKQSEVLDELEAHLREEVAQETRDGMDAEQAFKNAVQKIGTAKALKKEFAKNNGVKRMTSQKFKRGFLKFLGFPAADGFPALSDFPASTRETLEHARTEALYFHHDFIGTEHVLLGLFSETSGIVPAVLRRLGVEHERVRMEVEKMVAAQPSHTVGPVIPYTPRARRALKLATAEAKSLNRANVGPEHILLGLLREGTGVAGLVLRNLGVDVEKARAEVFKE